MVGLSGLEPPTSPLSGAPDKGEVGGSSPLRPTKFSLILRCGNAHILMYASRYHALSQEKLPVQRFANDGAIAQLGLSGLEPPTSPLSGVRSNHLSYKPVEVFTAVFHQTICVSTTKAGSLR